MNATLYEALKETANEINSKNPELGFYALRKVAAVNANSPLEKLVKVGDDLVLLASKITEN